jgi:hypothetical protein
VVVTGFGIGMARVIDVAVRMAGFANEVIRRMSRLKKTK